MSSPFSPAAGGGARNCRGPEQVEGEGSVPKVRQEKTRGQVFCPGMIVAHGSLELLALKTEGRRIEGRRGEVEEEQEEQEQEEKEGGCMRPLPTRISVHPFSRAAQTMTKELQQELKHSEERARAAETEVGARESR